MMPRLLITSKTNKQRCKKGGLACLAAFLLDLLKVNIFHRNVEKSNIALNFLRQKDLKWVMVGSRLMSVGNGG